MQRFNQALPKKIRRNGVVMNKRAYIFYFSVILMGVLLSFFAGRKYAFEDAKSNAPRISEVNEPFSRKEVEGYWLKLEQNHVVIYEKDQKELIAETDIRKSDCSSKDIRMLENGIYLENIESLCKFLQAHTS